MNESPREIKFRAWDEDQKGMIQVTTIELSGGQDEVPWVMGFYMDSKEQTHTIFNFLNPPLMQFTGLLDKNGKEIYEGDILYVPNWGAEKRFYGKVIWHIDGWALKVKGDFAPYSFTGDWEKTTIKGNIYENPELLGGNH